MCSTEQSNGFSGLTLSLGEKQGMTPIRRPIPKLRKAPQPPLSRPGATPDSDRAKKPHLTEPFAYVSPQGGGGGSVLANGPAVGEWEPLDLISFGNNRIAFRTITGHFLSCDTNAGNLLSAATWLTLLPECVFTFEYPLG